LASIFGHYIIPL